MTDGDAELAHAFPKSSLTLLNMQTESGDDTIDSTAVGEEVITDVAAQAGLDEADYEASVVVSDDITDALVSEVRQYDTVCVGATGTSTVAQALYGSIPQRIGNKTDVTVVMARGEQRAPRTIRQAIVQRLEG